MLVLREQEGLQLLVYFASLGTGYSCETASPLQRFSGASEMTWVWWAHQGLRRGVMPNLATLAHLTHPMVQILEGQTWA